MMILVISLHSMKWNVKNNRSMRSLNCVTREIELWRMMIFFPLSGFMQMRPGKASYKKIEYEIFMRFTVAICTGYWSSAECFSAWIHFGLEVHEWNVYHIRYSTHMCVRQLRERELKIYVIFCFMLFTYHEKLNLIFLCFYAFMVISCVWMWVHVSHGATL